MLNSIVNSEIKFTGKANAEANFIGNSFNFNKPITSSILFNFSPLRIDRL